MANITRYSSYSPVEDLFNEFTRGFFVKPLAFPTPSDLQIKAMSRGFNLPPAFWSSTHPRA